LGWVTYAITGKLPVLELALPFPVMVPLPEVGNTISGTAFTVHFFLLPGGTVGYPAHPRLIRPSVCPSDSDITFNYSAENLLIPTIKATIETSWY
jgi:hypothetical protein